jgi:lipoprotein-anchoring transpeptidase ErfK/SrfK
MVFKSRRPTGEILKPNAPGRDPIVSRILWLHGKEWQNRNTFRRCIYIHGTPEEWRLGTPASYGCIRMSSNDVIDLYKRIGVGAEVQVIRGSLKETPAGQLYAGIASP